MKKTVVALWTVYVVLMLADGYLTWLNTPDLAREGNPLVAVLGFGWGALFLANLIVMGLYLWLTWFAFVRYQPPTFPGIRNMREYVSQLYFNRPDRYRWVFYRFPKNWKPVWAFCGFSLGLALPAARAVLVFEWTVITLYGSLKAIPWYWRFRRAVPFGRVDLYVSLLVAVVVMIADCFLRYRNHQRRAALQETSGCM